MAKAKQEFSEAKIRQVKWMLKAGKTKKACCEHLGIAYNTTRLTRIIKEFDEEQLRTSELKEKRKKQELTDSIKKSIIDDYVSGDSQSAIADRYYITAYRVKKVLVEGNVPIRARGKNKAANVEHVVQDLDAKFVIGEKVFVPHRNFYGEITRVFDEEYAESFKDGRQRWVELHGFDKLKEFDTPKEDVHFQTYWQLPSGEEWKMNAVKEMIRNIESHIEETGREFYELWRTDDYGGFYKFSRDKLFPVRSTSEAV